MSIKIVDIIVLKNKQTMVVVNRSPVFLYERMEYKGGNILVSEDCGFYSCYQYDYPKYGKKDDSKWKAFSGRKFKIPLKDGTDIDTWGQYWYCQHPNSEKINIESVGVSTLKELKKTYVFSSGFLEKKIINDWLENNNPSNDYYKYKKKG